MRWPRRVVVVAAFVLASAGCGTTTTTLIDTSEAHRADVVVTNETRSTTTTSTSTTTTTSTTSTTTSAPTSTTATTAAPTTTAPPAFAPVPALLYDADNVPINGQTSGVLWTATGIPVPVIGQVDATTWRVWTPCGQTADLRGVAFVDHVDFVIDPGHGGSGEPGAVGPNGLEESDVNLGVAQRAAAGLEAAGFSVLLTRDSDRRLPIVTRAEIALALNPIAFISVHHNAAATAPSSRPGTETYFQQTSGDSRRLAGLIYEESVNALQSFGADWVSASDAGVLWRPNQGGGDFYGILRRPAAVTSVLTEFAYITNPSEEALLARADVQQGLADSIVRAAVRFTDTADPGSGFVAEPNPKGFGSSGSGRTTDCVDPDLGT